MTSTLHDHIYRRLASSGADQHPWSLLIVAALDGAPSLASYLEGTRQVSPPASPATAVATSEGPAPEPPGVYLGAITVAGFRGVGPSTMLPLNPGPGLTLVVGRNGSGKSSFAEGVEVLFTGTSLRWEGRTKAWKLGWRNLHQPHDTSVSADLMVEGSGALSVTRTWAAGADLAASVAATRAKGAKAKPFEALAWTKALDTFRPFLSYNELGSLLEDGPSALYDALSTVLGLEEFVHVERSLADARKAQQALVDAAKDGAKALAAAADATAIVAPKEARAVHLAAKLNAKAWDLPALRALAEGRVDTTRDALDTLQRLASLAAPDVDAVQAAATRVRGAAQVLTALAGTDGARSLARARLLQQALAFHASHADTTCPVCGTANGISGRWREQCEREVSSLLAEAQAVDDASRAVDGAVRAAHALLQGWPGVPSPAAGELPSLGALRNAQSTWLSARDQRDVRDPLALAEHLESHVLDVADVVARVAAEARAALQAREDAWRPLSQALNQWLPLAERAAPAGEHVKHCKDAEKWWKEAAAAIRDERFAPIAARAMDTWRQLRLQSNVDLGSVGLEGAATKRRVTLDVTVDGAPADALGVMSQGELHSLALSLFLPRATLPDSPFRFICVDDPVQSMDPARVEGLARVLADTAKTRQVIVFTHDDRLPEATRRLGLPALVLAVTRRANSVVEVSVARDPVSGHLSDAHALLKTNDLPADVAARVIPGFCRLALEAACMTTVRQKRLKSGAAHQQVEDVLMAQQKLYPLMALALFDDEARVGDVLARLGKVGRWAVDAFHGCNRGAHERHDGDLEELVNDTRRLATSLLGGGK